MKTHYDSLGIEKTASVQEIKAAFRKLSLQHHPDVSNANDNGARFKEIANAASVLLNPKTRKQYDNHRSVGPYGSSAYHSQHAYYQNRPNTRSPYASSSQGWFYRIHRPSNYILGPLAFFGTVATIQYVLGTNHPNNHNQPNLTSSNNNTHVQAWKNPHTKQWEQPAPWDPLYRQLQPKLESVPRQDVHARSR